MIVTSRDLECPHCRAPAGQPCVFPAAGKGADGYHASRRKAFQDYVVRRALL